MRFEWLTSATRWVNLTSDRASAKSGRHGAHCYGTLQRSLSTPAPCAAACRVLGAALLLWIPLMPLFFLMRQFLRSQAGTSK